MTVIRPVSDLRNYPSVLEETKDGNIVYLTKNGRGAYVIMETSEFKEYLKDRASMKLMSELSKAKVSGYISAEDVKNHFRDRINEL
ncbi:MAG: hypothetical protein IK151_02780 [Erysipelotrichaceae bacterium]|nr:hypothetical protein [Erysipelotrichaceae bacterium]